jgi:alkylation response protein AidB-like acyl-CoA dehydrogenase
MIGFQLSEEQEQMRQLAHRFALEEIRPVAAEYDEREEMPWPVLQAAARIGLLAYAYPETYGGGGIDSVLTACVVAEELSWGCLGVSSAILGCGLAAVPIQIAGTEEQKAHYIPWFCDDTSVRTGAFALTEPEAGSDVASLRTRAVRDGDHYVLNGQKAWTSNGRLADWIFVLVRTDPTRSRRQEGISFLLVDLATPGIDVRPVDAMTGYPTFAAEFFDDVRVPVDNLLGPEHEGWRVAKALLDHERSNITRAAQAQRFVSELVAWCRQREGTGDDLRRDHVARIELARLVERVEVGRALSYRVADLQARGELTPGQAALSKLYHSEFAVEVKSVGSRLLGMAGLLMPSDELSVLYGHYSEGLLLSLLHRIGGGTSEIQRDVIATTGLGLPR